MMGDSHEAWTSESFRQNVRGKIEEAIRQSGNPTAKSATEMESHVFNKAKTKEEYLGFVARLILHVREMNSKKPQVGGQLAAGGGGPDPMSALRNLAGVQGQQAGVPQQQGAPMMGGPMVGPPPNARFTGPGVMANQMVNYNLQKLRRQQGPGGQMMTVGPDNMAAFPPGSQPPPGAQTYQYQSHSPLQVPGGQAVPSPVVSNSGMAPSPIAYAPSPTSQIIPSPVSGFTGRAPNAPSPSGAGTVLSPRNPQEEQLYLEKLRQLSKYIEPLRKMMISMDKDESERKDMSRMKQLLEILTEPNKSRCSLDVLLKCEQVLERMDFKQKPTDGGGMAPKPQEYNVFQPLLDAIAANIKSPNFNHIMHKTFGHIAAGLLGPRQHIPSPRGVKRKRVEAPVAGDIPDVVQGEVARLDPRFKVQLDASRHPGSGVIHLVCQLDDKNLPCVPPISMALPPEYPHHPPRCNLADSKEYETTPFLQRIQTLFNSRMENMPPNFTVSLILNAWEMSVRQACSPIKPEFNNNTAVPQSYTVKTC